jgi:hypothetical protein
MTISQSRQGTIKKMFSILIYLAIQLGTKFYIFIAVKFAAMLQSFGKLGWCAFL